MEHNFYYKHKYESKYFSINKIAQYQNPQTHIISLLLDLSFHNPKSGRGHPLARLRPTFIAGTPWCFASGCAVLMRHFQEVVWGCFLVCQRCHVALVFPLPSPVDGIQVGEERKIFLRHANIEVCGIQVVLFLQPYHDLAQGRLIDMRLSVSW